MIGTTLSHYTILEKLGEGGMGEVYLAQDTDLSRKIALKVLRLESQDDSELLARFQREARAVAALNHPNIVTIHSVEVAHQQSEDGGEGAQVHFLTMEVVDGVGLNQKIGPSGLDSERIFELAIPLADALAAAHKAGIAHRDLKPENVMLTNDGRVKILDFGLAKLSASDDENNEATQTLTQTGLVMGTVPYMSPEQVVGGAVDHRTDIFALGVILYEMATGQRPFQGASSGHLVSAILRDEPPPVTDIRAELPFHLGRIIRRCLEKEPDRRYQSALDVRNELDALRQEIHTGVLRTVSGPVPVAAPDPSSSEAEPNSWKRLIAWGAPVVVVLVLAGWWLTRNDDSGAGTAAVEAALATPGIAVLPFENLGATEEEYFAAGITEEINSRLAGVSGLRVISRNTAVRYADSELTLREIGEEIDVDYILGGSVRWARSDDGSQVRITPRLTRVRDDSTVWSETYDRRFEDVFAVQSEIADSVRSELGITLLAGNESTAEQAPPTDNADAYQAYLRGLDNRNKLSFESQQLEIEMFERAVELDPEFAQAWARLALAYSNRYFNGDFRRDFLELAEQARDRALDLAPTDPLVRLSNGFVLYYGYQRFDEALEIFSALHAEAPSDVAPLTAMAYIHRRQGRFEKTIEELESALLLDPQSIDYRVNLAQTYAASRRHERALEVMSDALAIAPDVPQLYVQKVGYLLATSGDTERALELLDQSPSSEETMQAYLTIDWMNGDLEGALERLEAYQPTNVFYELNRDIQLGLTLHFMGLQERAEPILTSANDQFISFIEERPPQASSLVASAVLSAALGKRDFALEQVDKGIEVGKADQFTAKTQVEAKALIYSLLGEPEPAIDLLIPLLEAHYSDCITPELLKTFPLWSGLWESPRFAQLVES